MMVYDLWGQICSLINPADLRGLESVTLGTFPKEHHISKRARPAHNTFINKLHATNGPEGFFQAAKYEILLKLLMPFLMDFDMSTLATCHHHWHFIVVYFLQIIPNSTQIIQ